jgi:hypothetical protein
MTTTSANVAAVARPFADTLRRKWSAGTVYDLSVFTKKKKKKKRKTEGVFEIIQVGDRVLIEAKKEKRHKVDGKLGVWRTMNGRHYFFPDDGSGPIPPFNF